MYTHTYKYIFVKRPDGITVKVIVNRDIVTKSKVDII